MSSLLRRLFTPRYFRVPNIGRTHRWHYAVYRLKDGDYYSACTAHTPRSRSSQGRREYRFFRPSRDLCMGCEVARSER